MTKESITQKDNPHIETNTMLYKDGKLEYLDINHETADPSHNKIVVIPGFTQGIEVMQAFGEALGDDGQREVFVLDQPGRFKKTFDKKFKGEIGLDQQVDALLEFLIEEGLAQEPVDFVGNSFATIILASAAIRAKKLGFKCFDSEAGANTFFIAPSGVNPKENRRTLGGRWTSWMIKNAADGKTLDPEGEMLKAGVKNVKSDLGKVVNEAGSIAKYKIDFDQLKDSGVKPIQIGYAHDRLMPFQEETVQEGAVSLIDNMDNAPKLPNEEPYPGATSFKQFKEKTGLSGKEARKAWVHHYRAAEHNDMQFHPNRTARFILKVLFDKEQQK